MRQVILIALLCLLFGDIFPQGNDEIVIGHIDRIESEILGETREIWVHVPDAENDTYLPTDYPVVYLLDGDIHFRSVVGMIHQLSSVNGNTLCPRMIVVGILNTNRTRDLIPLMDDTGNPSSNRTAASGSGENFLAFIEKELIPHIESNYPTMPFRTLIGHSFGGLFTVYALVHQAELFNAYVAIDPSIWLNSASLLKEIKSGKIDKKYDSRSFVLGIANTMAPGMDTLMVRKDTSSTTLHIRSLLDLHDYLSHNAGDHLNYLGRYYPGETHSSVALMSGYDALRFIFRPFSVDLETDDYTDPEANVAAKLKKHYARLSKEYGFKILPSERQVNQMGYQFLGMGQLGKAENLFKLNVKNYPTSFNVHDSLGDFYLTTGEIESAALCYEKSLAINPDSPSKVKLEAIRNGH